MDTNTLTNQMRTEVTMYSIIVGLSILVLCVAPCVLFALLSKCFQSQSPRRRSSTLRSVLTAGMKLLEAAKEPPPLDSIGYGQFGPMQMSISQLDCIERIISVKSKLPCVTMWKAYAPVVMFDNDLSEKRLVAIKKISETSSSDVHGVSHSNCLKSELQMLSHIPPHYHLLNLLGVCLNNSNPVALIMEYTPYGPLHTYLLIKRRAMLSHNTNKWAGLDYVSDESLAIKALEETDRPCISPLLDNYEARSRAFSIPLCEPFTEVDVLLFGLQIACTMDFLCGEEHFHKRMSTESILIAPGFYLKVIGMDFDVPMMHKTNSIRALRRTASGRNQNKWDAPEVMEKEDHSELSEVWRFGMTLWEICSLGDTPFEGIPARSLADLLIRKGEVPCKPEGTSDKLYSLMTLCWEAEPTSRPTFREIVGKIKTMLRTHEFTAASSTAKPTSLAMPTSAAMPRLSPVSELDSAPLIGRLSPASDQDSITGSLHRRSSCRPIVLPITTQIPHGMRAAILSSSHIPLLDSPGSGSGYLETDV